MSTEESILEVLFKILRERFEIWEDVEMVTKSSLGYRPDAFFFTSEGRLFIIEVKKQKATIDHIRVLVDFLSDLAPVYGSPIEVILSSPEELDSEARQYIEKLHSKYPFRFHFVYLTPREVARIESLDTASAELKRESIELLKGIV